MFLHIVRRCKSNKKTEIIKELKKDEKSGFIIDFDRTSFLKNIHQKYLSVYHATVLVSTEDYSDWHENIVANLHRDADNQEL